MATIIKNGLVILPDFSGFTTEPLIIENGYIVDKITDDSSVTEIDAEGGYVLPGLIDIHNHGALGISYSSLDDDFEAALSFAAKEGITSIAPTLYVNSIDNLTVQVENILNKRDSYKNGARMIGIHVEGPFIASNKTGAMRAPSDKPTVESFRRLVDSANGFIKVVTIAPEVENAEEIIKEGKKLGIRMSIGHTDATYETAAAAINAGATGATHTFNAMRPFSHRDPGVLGAVLTDKRVSCEIICDFIHLAEGTIKLICAAKGSDNVIVVSDNIAPAGFPNGDYVVDNILNTVKDGVCTVNEGKTIAGSIQSQTKGARNLIKIGIPLNEVSKMCSFNPARAIGVDDKVGSLAAGKIADIIIADEELNVKKTLINGIQIK